MQLPPRQPTCVTWNMHFWPNHSSSHSLTLYSACVSKPKMVSRCSLLPCRGFVGTCHIFSHSRQASLGSNEHPKPLFSEEFYNCPPPLFLYAEPTGLAGLRLLFRSRAGKNLDVECELEVDRGDSQTQFHKMEDLSFYTALQFRINLAIWWILVFEFEKEDGKGGRHLAKSWILVTNASLHICPVLHLDFINFSITTSSLPCEVDGQCDIALHCLYELQMPRSKRWQMTEYIQNVQCTMLNVKCTMCNNVQSTKDVRRQNMTDAHSKCATFLLHFEYTMLIAQQCSIVKRWHVQI